jgi:hypothetical protein
VFASLEFLFHHVNAMHTVTGKQLRTMSKQLAQAIKPTFQYTSIIRENFIGHLKQHFALEYYKATQSVVETAVDDADPGYHWLATDADPDDSSVWPVTCNVDFVFRTCVLF